MHGYMCGVGESGSLLQEYSVYDDGIPPGIWPMAEYSGTQPRWGPPFPFLFERCASRKSKVGRLEVGTGGFVPTFVL